MQIMKHRISRPSIFINAYSSTETLSWQLDEDQSVTSITRSSFKAEDCLVKIGKEYSRGEEGALAPSTLLVSKW